MRPRSRNDFAIAVICALPVEADAVEALFDETYDRLGRFYGKQPGDTNAYVNGRIGQHNVVLCYMPGMGKESAASVASTLRISYTEIQVALVVGICGGAPSPSSTRQIYLGDVVISDSVVAYDFGRQYPGGFRRKTNVKDTLGRPDREIRTLLAALKATRSQIEFQDQMLENLGCLQGKETRWQHPGLDDILFKASYLHKHHAHSSASRCGCSTDNSPYDICDEALEIECDDLGCDDNYIIRQRIGTTKKKASVHIGTIASADTVMKSGEHRDAITKLEGVLGFEMEAAGVWDNIPCIIVKGVCDYADSHKRKTWQCYAAATGASAAKAFLGYWKPVGNDGTMPDDEIADLQRLSLRSPVNDQNAQTPSNVVDRRKIRTAHGPKRKSTTRQRSKSTRGNQATVLLDDMHATHEEGLVLLSQQQYADAKSLFQEAFESRKHTLGRYHEDTLASLSGLGDALSGQKNYHEAEAAYRDAWVRRKRALGENHQDTLLSLYQLGEALYKQDKWAEAEVVYRDVWEVRKRALGANHEDTLTSLSALGNALFHQEKYSEAEAAYRDVWVGKKRTLGENDTGTISSLYNLGTAIYKQAKWAEAEGVYRDVWEARKRALGTHHKTTLSSLDTLGDALFVQEKCSEAEAVYRDVWMRQKRALGENHQDTLASLNQLGEALDFQAKYAEAEDVYRDAWKRRKETLGADHEDTLLSLYSLGWALHRQAKYTEAEGVWLPLWESRKKTLGEHHEDTLSSLYWLAGAFREQGKYTEAGDAYRATWEGRKRMLGPHHGNTISALYWLGVALYNQGKYREAEGVYRELWDAHKKTLGQHHKDTLSSLSQLGWALRAQDKYAEAEGVFRDAWEGRKQTFAKDHEHTLSSLYWLRWALRKQGKYAEADGLGSQ